MGLTLSFVKNKSASREILINKKYESDKVIALAGNPNVGKSTVFNQLTGLNQHTGNWAGKTVTTAQGYLKYNGTGFIIVDIPGTYSLIAHSTDEEIAAKFICFENVDAVIVVCDATNLERNLNLVLQTLEITDNVVLCVNLIDEAKKKSIEINLEQLSIDLGISVVSTNARSNRGLEELMCSVSNILENKQTPIKIKYTDHLEHAISMIETVVSQKLKGKLNSRWISLNFINYKENSIKLLNDYLGFDISEDEAVSSSIESAREYLRHAGVAGYKIEDEIAMCIINTAEKIAKNCVSCKKSDCNNMERKLDTILTSRLTGIPIMIMLLGFIFWLTIIGSNYPSQLLFTGLFWIGDRLTELLILLNVPFWFREVFIMGIYRVLAWVVAVMLPPMAIFFPLFAFLEDLGYLPRVAFNLDKCFKKSRACGKQALTMCMGFGCNAAGVIGCRIIDSPRERLIAIMTNNFVPCNGRFPTLIAIITMFFAGEMLGWAGGFFSVMMLTVAVTMCVITTLLVSRLLSETILKGITSSFILELPPYRKPQIGKIIVRSIFDRTLFVLARAIIVAAPAGLIIWLMANVLIGDISILNHVSMFLDPFARAVGLDGIILLAFILGFPANEIVVPIMIMAYMSTGSILELESLAQLKELLVSNGWTWITAVSTLIFTLMHWPCSTTCLTIMKETKSIKWTIISILLPTATGFFACFIFANIARLL